MKSKILRIISIWLCETTTRQEKNKKTASLVKNDITLLCTIYYWREEKSIWKKLSKFFDTTTFDNCVFCFWFFFSVELLHISFIKAYFFLPEHNKKLFFFLVKKSISCIIFFCVFNQIWLFKCVCQYIIKLISSCSWFLIFFCSLFSFPFILLQIIFHKKILLTFYLILLYYV